MALDERARRDVPSAEDLISFAWNATKVAMHLMPALFGSAMFLCGLIALLDIGMEWGGELLGKQFGPISSLALIGLWGALSILLEVCVLAPVAVAVHRKVLLGEETRGFIAWNHSRIWRFLGWTLLLEFATTVPGLSLFVVPENSKLLAIALGCVLVMIISVRLLMIFPAVAVEMPTTTWKARIIASWDSTRGHFWCLALALLAPVVVLIFPLLALSVVAAVLTFIYGFTDTFYRLHLVIDPILAALKPIIIAFGAAVASGFYIWLSRGHVDTDAID